MATVNSPGAYDHIAAIDRGFDHIAVVWSKPLPLCKQDLWICGAERKQIDNLEAAIAGRIAQANARADRLVIDIGIGNAWIEHYD